MVIFTVLVLLFPVCLCCTHTHMPLLSQLLGTDQIPLYECLILEHDLLSGEWCRLGPGLECRLAGIHSCLHLCLGGFRTTCYHLICRLIDRGNTEYYIVWLLFTIQIFLQMLLMSERNRCRHMTLPIILKAEAQANASVQTNRTNLFLNVYIHFIIVHTFLFYESKEYFGDNITVLTKCATSLTLRCNS